LFHNSTESIPQNSQTQQLHRRVMSTSNIPQELGDLFDFSAPFVDDLESPADSTMFSPPHYAQPSFATVNEPVTIHSTGTVSPKDLMADPGSAPPSTSFTDMSTPSFESPGYFSHDTSPLFADSEIAHEEWPPLFPVAGDAFASVNFDDTHVGTTLSKPAPAQSPLINADSSPGESPRPGRPSARHSSISGVKSKNREKPLPPIRYDSNDPVAIKRARNTEAARKSRARKVELQDQMERRIADLEKSLQESQQREAESRQRELYWKSVAEGTQ
jgi:hypothetical protein